VELISLSVHPVQLDQVATIDPCRPKLRVMHCIPSLGGGGAESQLGYLAAGLTNSGVDVHVAYHVDGSAGDKIQLPCAKLHKLRIRHNYSPALLIELIGLIRKLRPDIIQTWLPQMDIAAGFAAIVTGTPFIVSERSAAPSYPGTWKDKIRFWVGSHATLVVANSDSGSEYWTGQKRIRKVKVIGNGVPLKQIEQARGLSFAPLTIDPRWELLLFAGRFSAEKNVMNLLEGLRLVLQERNNARAVLFGEGPQYPEIVDWVKTHGLEKRIQINSYTDQLWSWMRQATLLVSVSRVEGSPNVILEAAALKCPLVLSDIPAHRELFGEECVFFTAFSSPSGIARTIVQALQSSELARQKAEAAYESVSTRSVESAVSAYLEVYRQVLAG
jgi:glycosyltransferase involved in cell wall biosynthesis